MTKAEIMQQARWQLDELNTASGSWLKDSDAGEYDLTQAVEQAYRDYARATKCFKVGYTLAATIGTATYAYSAFGTSSAGARMFELYYVAYNSEPLTARTEAYLDSVDRDWRHASNGTPTDWIAYGEQKIKLYVPPDATSNIYVEGFETPDMTAWTASVAPLFHETSHHLLSVRAAILIAYRDNETAARQSALWPVWAAGVEADRVRIHDNGNPEIIIGRFAETRGNTLPPFSDSITLST